MKKLNSIGTLLTLVSTITLGTVLPQNEANAGIALLAFAGVGAYVGNRPNADYDAWDGYTIGAGWFGFIVTIAGTGIYTSGGAGGALILTLDADASISQDALTEKLSNQYPFIDNRDVVSQLSSALKAKIPAGLKLETNQMGLVSLSPNETLQILSGMDLTPEQSQLIIEGLK